jgi:hypothetical protein
MNACARTIKLAVMALSLTACAVGNEEVLRSDESSMAIRSYQSRDFDADNGNVTIRAVIATLQDLDFVLDNLEPKMGAVTATLLDGRRLRMTVIVKARDDRLFQVRASAQSGGRPIDNPEFYRDFFVALEKSLFLSTHGVD